MAADREKGQAGSASAEIGKYLEILAKDPNSRVFAPLAEAYRKAGLLDDAIETALEGLNVHPNYLGGRVALGRALYEKKRYAEAAEEMRKVVKAAPDNIIAHRVLGQVALAQGALPDAEKAFRMVVLLDPHDQEAKRALADIGSGAPATAPAAPLASPPAVAATAAAPPAPASLVPPPALEASWAKRSLEPPPPALAGLESHRESPGESLPPRPLSELAPLEEIEAGPLSIELEEPGERPVPLPLDAPQLESEEGQLPALEGLDDDLSPLSLDAGVPPVDLAEPPVPAPEVAIELFGREPGGTDMQPAPGEGAAEFAAPDADIVPPSGADSPFEVFGRQKRVPPPASGKGSREAYAEIELEATAHAAAAAPATESDQDAVFEIFTRDPRDRLEAGTRNAGSGERSASERLDLEPTAHLPLEAAEGEPPVIELREEIPRIDVQGELELALSLEQAPAAMSPAEPAAAGEEIGWEQEAAWQSAGDETAEESPAVHALSPEEAATEELVWQSPAEHGDLAGQDAVAAPEAAEVPAGPAESTAAAEPEPGVELEPPAALAAQEPVLDLVGRWDESAPEVSTAGELPAEPEAVRFQPTEEMPMLEPESSLDSSVGEPRAAEATDTRVRPMEEILSLEEEIPSVDIAGEIAPEAVPVEEPVTAPAPAPAPAPIPEPAPPPATESAGAGRGVFDTETLASIYINQGFYGRAAAIYERLVAGSPEDAGLRSRLEEVRALERAQGQAVPGDEGTAPAAGRPNRSETIRRLEALLAAFRGGRTR